MRKFDGVEELCVVWAAIWMPEPDLGGARKLVDEFKARLFVLNRNKNGQGKTDFTGEKTSKRRSGRPRKRF
jgi:hypothetical protein